MIAAHVHCSGWGGVAAARCPGYIRPFAAVNAALPLAGNIVPRGGDGECGGFALLDGAVCRVCGRHVHIAADGTNAVFISTSPCRGRTAGASSCVGVVAACRPPGKGMFFKDSGDRHGPGGHGKGILLTDGNAAGRDLPLYKVIALRWGGRQGNSVPHIRGSRGCGVHGSGRGIARSALDGYGNIVVNGRPLGVEGRRSGHGAGRKRPLAALCKVAVTVPPVKPVACSGGGCRLGHGAAIRDKLHGDRPCPAIRIKGNRMERGALAAWAAVRINAAARGRDGKGIAARLGDLEVIGRAAGGNRAALGAAALVELDGIAGSVCNRAPCGLAGGVAVPFQICGGVKRLADGKLLCRFRRRIPICFRRRHFHPIGAGGRGGGIVGKLVANRPAVVLMPCNGDGRCCRISGVGIAAAVQGHGAAVMGLIQICTNGNGRRQFWRDGAASGNGNILRPGSALRQRKACPLWNIDRDIAGECHAIRQDQVAIDIVCITAAGAGPDALTVCTRLATRSSRASPDTAGNSNISIKNNHCASSTTIPTTSSANSNRRFITTRTTRYSNISTKNNHCATSLSGLYSSNCTSTNTNSSPRSIRNRCSDNRQGTFPLDRKLRAAGHMNSWTATIGY